MMTAFTNRPPHTRSVSDEKVYVVIQGTIMVEVSYTMTHLDFLLTYVTIDSWKYIFHFLTIVCYHLNHDGLKKPSRIANDYEISISWLQSR